MMRIEMCPSKRFFIIPMVFLICYIAVFPALAKSPFTLEPKKEWILLGTGCDEESTPLDCKKQSEMSAAFWCRPLKSMDRLLRVDIEEICPSRPILASHGLVVRPNEDGIPRGRDRVAKSTALF